MAETYVALTKPETIDENWPPKIEKPVTSDATSYFPAAASDPVANSQEVAIAHGHRPDQPGRIVSNEPSRLAPSGAPVSNDRGTAVIMHRDAPPRIRQSDPVPIQQDVSMHPGGAPLRNDSAATIHHGPVALPAPHQEPQRVFRQGGVVSNENNVSFVPSAPHAKPLEDPRVNPTDPYAPMNLSGDVFVAPSRGAHNSDGSPQQFYASGATLNADNDRTFGKSGESHKVAGRDDVTFGGAGGTMSIGGTDITQAASGDTTQAAGSADKIMTPSGADFVGNHETQRGATGEPANNRDFTGFQQGASGKPIRRNAG